MFRCMKNPRILKVRLYDARLIDLNEYLASFPGATMAEKNGVTELNEILLNSMPNSWPKQAYVQGFYFETIYFKKAVNMFERMEIGKSIYEVVVTPSYKKLLGQKPNVLDSVGIREENPPRQILTLRSMGALESAVNDMWISQRGHQKPV